MKDVVIIGMGISGVSAGIYAKQAGLNVLMFEVGAPGGLLNNIDKINNYAGINTINGPDFAVNLFNQVNESGVSYKFEGVKDIECYDDYCIVNTLNGSYKTKNVIIATGRKPKLLGLSGEEELLGRGISTCALCDGHFFKGKDIALVGAGNAALQEALYLSNIVNKIYILMRRSTLAGSLDLIEKVISTRNIEVLSETYIENINTYNGEFKNLTLNTGDELDVAGLFVYVGYYPDSKFVLNLGITNSNGYIEVNENLETSKNRVFAIGDVTKKDIYQLISAASDGARVVGKLYK